MIKGFSDRLMLPEIPPGPGVCLIEDETGNVLQIAASNNIRRRIGEMLDNEGTICVHGPEIYAVQINGGQVYVRWKLPEDYKEEKHRLMESLSIQWKKERS